jgi:hypothetical protein
MFFPIKGKNKILGYAKEERIFGNYFCKYWISGYNKFTVLKK